MSTPLPLYASTQLARRLRLIKAVVWGFVVLLAAGFVGYGFADRSQSLDEARERLTVLANLLSDNIESQLSFVERQMRGMQGLLSLGHGAARPGDDAIREVLLSWCKNDSACMDLLVLNAAGEIEHWTGPGTPPSIADRDYVRAHLGDDQSGVYVGIPQLSRVHTGRWFFAMSVAERDATGRLLRIYVSIRDLSRSFDYSGLVSYAKSSSFGVMGTAGEVYVREPDRDSHMGKRIPDVDLVLASAPGETKASVLASRLDSVERLIVTRRVARYPLFAAATQSEDGIYGPWRYRAALVGVLWLLLTLVALYVGRRLADDARIQNYLASIDWLTGILNRRALMSEALREQERRAENGGLGLMMIDLDHFKRINDSFGHTVGDEVLRRVAETLRLSCRGSDILGRYGGEEFLLLLPGADEQRIAKVGEKLRAAVEAIPALEFADRSDYPDSMSISVGCAILRGEGESLDHAIARADQALYQAKNAGRNRVVIAPAQA